MYDVTSLGLSDHWIDAALAALVSAGGYLINRYLHLLDDRNKRIEEKFEKVEDCLTALKERLAAVETICRVRHGTG